MFDNLREQANSSPFYENEAQFQSVEEPGPATLRSSARILGMTPIQRFFIALMLMILVSLVGAMFLLVTGKFGLF